MKNRIRPPMNGFGKLRRKPCSCSCALYSSAAAGPFDDRQILGLAALVFVMLEHHRGEIHAREHVAEPRGEVFFFLQIAAERQHRDVDRERERRAEAHDVLVVALRRPAVRHAREARAGQRHHQRAHGVADREADVAEQRAIELVQRLARDRGCAPLPFPSARTGWQRTAPWPKMIRLRVRMFAPSTVIATGITW